MGQQANIIAFDGEATPLSHTFVGEGVTRDKDGTLVAAWKEVTAGVPDYAQIRHVQKKRKLPSGVFRISIRTEVPVMEARNAANATGYTAPPKVAHVATTDLVGMYHERSIEIDRRNSAQLTLNIANGIATAVVPVTTGPAAELIQKLVIAT